MVLKKQFFDEATKKALALMGTPVENPKALEQTIKTMEAIDDIDKHIKNLDSFEQRVKFFTSLYFFFTVKYTQELGASFDFIAKHGKEILNDSVTVSELARRLERDGEAEK